ncbi:MAG TPA: ABC transporter permease [Spirochaetia bacterium]|nr:ABC transporter permease [Spirochaetia bacterium]
MAGQAMAALRPRKLDVFGFLYRWGTIITIGLLILFFGVVTKSFLSPGNLINILRSISIVTVIAIGVSLSLSVGGFDLSVGSVASLADAVVISLFIWYGRGTVVSIVVAVAVCLVVGGFNAFLIVRVRIPDMLATLATMFIFQGVAMTYTNGGSITANMMMPDGSTAAGKLTGAFSAIGQVPAIILIMIVVVIVVQIYLSSTKHGRYMYVVGGNMEAARLSGIPLGRYRTAAYLISSAFAALGGIMLASRIGSSQVNAGSAYLMDAVAAAYIGFSLGGSGKPNAVGTFIGAVLIGILQNGLVMVSVPYYAMDIIKGAVLALALALTYIRKK